MDANKNLTQCGLAFGLGLDSVAYFDLRTSALIRSWLSGFAFIRVDSRLVVWGRSPSLLPIATKSTGFLQILQKIHVRYAENPVVH